MHKSIIFCIFIFIASVFSDGGSIYNGYKMMRVEPKTKEEIKTLEDLQNIGIQFQMFKPTLEKPWNLLVPPKLINDVLSILRTNLIDFDEVISDVGSFIQSQKVGTSTNNGRISWDQYYTLDAIYEYLEAQVALHPTLASIENIGFSYENRTMPMIKISDPTGTTPKPVIYIETNIHAREWITSAVGTHIIDQLLNGPDEEMKAFVDTFDFYILPIANPDGFSYTHTTDRFWRKTRSATPSPLGCIGSDPNRNFDAYWMENGGASDDPCSLVYAGSFPFSEPEVANMRDFMLRPEINDNMVMYLSLHSAGQYLLIPTGLDANKIPEYDDYMFIAEAAAEAHTDVFGLNFTAGSIFDLMYPATGSSLDWAYLNVNTSSKFHVTYELRDKGFYGHLLPPDQITDSCIEFLAGFKVILNELMLSPRNDDFIAFI